MHNDGLNYTQALTNYNINKTKHYYKFFDGWEGYSLLCPSFKNPIIMDGSDQSSKQDSLMFQINSCKNETIDGKCKSKQEISNFIDRIIVETWANFWKTDFTIYGERNGRRMEIYEEFNLLNSKYLTGNIFSLRENNVESEDSWLSFGQLSYNWNYYDLD